MIKTFMAMLLSGAMGAAGAVGYNRLEPPSPPDFSALHADLLALQDQMKQSNALQSAAFTQQNAALVSMNMIMQRSEADRLAAQARAQAQVDRYHADFNHVINSIPTK